MSYSRINYYINHISRTNSLENINCSKLFKAHKPACLEAWKEVVNQQERDMSWLVNHAYTAQENHPGYYFSRKELREYLEDLVYGKTYNGLARELAIFNWLIKKYPNLKFTMDDRVDTIFAVDIVVGNHADEILSGIQIKPDTYEHSQLNINKNNFFIELAEKVETVFYLEYNKVKGWKNSKELLTHLDSLLAS